MQLDCKRHAISGVRADMTCRKCARLNEKNATLDTTEKAGHFYSSTPSGHVAKAPKAAPRSSGAPATPAAKPPTVKAAAAVSVRGSMKNADATQLQKRRGCKFCRAAGRGVVWGVETCSACGELLNEVAARMRQAHERGIL